MGSTVTTDPYQVLGVSKDATPTAIRSAYRKLVLQTHPDKVQDESLRAVKQDEFQRIQQAYEILSDEAKKQQYDEQVKFAQQKKDLYNDAGRGGGLGERYEVRTAAPSREFDRKYEERRAARSFDDLPVFVDVHTRKHDGYGYEVRRTTRTHEKASRDHDDAREREAKERIAKDQSERRKTREREHRRDRDEKYRNEIDDYIEDDSRIRTEEHPRRKSGESRRREGRSTSDESLRREPRRRESGNDYDTDRKMYSAWEYITERNGARLQRSTTSNLYEGSGTIPIVAEESTVRRSSARRPSDRDRTRGGSGHSKSSRRDSPRESPIQIVEPSAAYEARPRVIPSMPTSASSPANIRIPLTPRTASQPLRSATMHVPVMEVHPVTPQLSRSSTMPVNSSSSTSRRRDPVMGSSKLKPSRPVEVDSGYSSPSTPETPWKSPIPTSTRHGAEYVFEDFEPRETRYSTSSGRRRRVVSESDDEDDDRHERSVSPHTRGRSSDHTRPPLARAETASARISPAVSYYATRETSSRPTMMADSPSYRKEPIISSSAASRGPPLHLRTGSGTNSTGYHSTPVRTLYREVHYSPRYGPEDIMYSEPRRGTVR